MTQFIVNQTKSFTIVASTESGNATLVLAEELRDNLKEMLENADTSEEAAAGFLDILGDDAPRYINAMAEISGIHADVGRAYAEGGLAAVEVMIANHGPNAGALADIGAALEDRDEFAGFTAAKPSDLADIFGYGMPDFGDPDPNSEEGQAAIEKLISDAQGGLMQDTGGDEGLNFGQKMVIAVGGVVGGYAGFWWGGGVAAFTTGGAGTPGGAIGGAVTGAVVGAGAGYIIATGATGSVNEAKDAGSDYVGGLLDEVQIPADPNAEYEGWMDFTPPWVEAQMKEGATYGQTLVDPNSERGIQGTKEFDPEAELNGLILTDPEAVKDAITAAEVQEAAEFHYNSTTTPVEPEFEFKPNLGNLASANGEEGYDNGDPAMATATEYIIGVQASEENDLSLQDTMIFNTNLQSGSVDSEGTSGAVLEGQISLDEANGYVLPEMM